MPDKRLALILFTVVLDVAGMGMIMPVLPQLLRGLMKTDEIALQYGVLIALYAFMQLIFSPVLGALSDRFGRRPVLLVSLAGAAVDYLVMAFSPTLAILYVGRIVAGITGANVAVATAYIADITHESQRARSYGFMNACFGLGFIAGPLLGGVLGNLSVHYPFMAAAALNGLNFVLASVLLPETRRGMPAPMSFARFNPLAVFARVAAGRVALPMITIYFVLYLVGQIPGSLWTVYGEDRFGWTPRDIGLSLAGFGLVHGLAQAFATGPAVRRLGERRAIIVGMLADGTGYLLMALITAGWMVYPIMPLWAAGGLALPALQALISRQTDAAHQGELQGTLVSLVSLSAIVGPLAVTGLYAATQHWWSGLVWTSAAVLYLLCIPLLRERRTPDS